MKKITLISTGVLLANLSFAQTLPDAIKKSTNERYAAAAIDFRNLISTESTKGENYFYYGENFFNNGDLDSANIFFQKGAEVNATYPLNYVGLGKVLRYNGKSADAKAQFYKAATLGANKNTEVMRKTAEAYINSENKNIDEAINILNAAIKIEPKNAQSYLLLGDAYLEKNQADGSTAIKEYSKAIDLNPKSAAGILRKGKLYQRSRNYQLALDLYKEAEQVDPNFAPAYREKAELYHLAGQKANAVESYRKYLELNNSDEARERYAGFLLNNKQYTEAITEVENLQKTGNTSLYLDRYLGYSYSELPGKVDTTLYRKGLDAMNSFFVKSSKNPKFKYLATDYKYKGLLLSKLGQDSLGVVEMQRAIDLDPKLESEIIGAIASTWMKAKKYDKAIEAYLKKAGNDPKNLTGQDYFELGRAYYFGPKDFVKSDSAFSKLTQAIPTFATGYFWRGKACVQQDPKNEKWLAKPHYEKGLELVKPEERTGSNKANVIEACEYLGYYYLTIKDNAKAKEYFAIIKELDPNNKKQSDFFKSPQGK